jgi:phage protein D
MRQATVTIIYNGVNISADIAPFLLSFEYISNESHKADTIEIKLEDKNQLWMSSYLPAKGDTISAKIVVTDWRTSGQNLTLPCGSFSVDEIDFTGPPSEVVIKAVSIPISSTVRSQIKTRAWERINLQAIAQDIASESNMTLMYESSCNPQYLRVDQVEISDLAFLAQLCENAAQAIKVRNPTNGSTNTIVIYDERTYEANPTVRTIDRLGGDVIEYSFKTKTIGTAKTANVSYSDPLTGKTATGTFTDPDPTNNGVTLNINDAPDGEYDSNLAAALTDSPGTDSVRKFGDSSDVTDADVDGLDNDIADATSDTSDDSDNSAAGITPAEMAKNHLRKANKKENTGTITLFGDPTIVGGVTVDLANFGAFNKFTYIVSKATHKIGTGYETEAEIRKCMNGY